MRFRGKRIRRRHLRKTVWIVITAFAAVAMILGTASSAFLKK